MDSAALNKIAKILPRLSSDSAGERIATIEALLRTLAAAGCDLHDLAAVVAGDHETPDEPDHADDLPGDWPAMVRRCIEATLYRDDRERAFLHTMERYAHAGRRPTARQAKWIVDIFTRE